MRRLLFALYIGSQGKVWDDEKRLKEPLCKHGQP